MRTPHLVRRDSRVRFEDEAERLDRLEANTPALDSGMTDVPLTPPGLELRSPVPGLVLDDSLPLPSHWTRSPALGSSQQFTNPFAQPAGRRCAASLALPVLRSLQRPLPRVSLVNAAPAPSAAALGFVDEAGASLEAASAAVDSAPTVRVPPPAQTRLRQPPIASVPVDAPTPTSDPSTSNAVLAPHRRAESLSHWDTVRSPLADPPPVAAAGNDPNRAPDPPGVSAHDAFELSASPYLSQQASLADPRRYPDLSSAPEPINIHRGSLPAYEAPGAAASTHRPAITRDEDAARQDMASPVRRAKSLLAAAGEKYRQVGTYAGLLALYSNERKPARPVMQRNGTAYSINLSQCPSQSSSSGDFDGELIDDDDPIVTGRKPNRIDDEKRAKDTFVAIANGDRKDEKNLLEMGQEASMLQRQTFILRLAKALMRYGTPSHRLESQLAAAARILEVAAQFVHLPSIIIVTFGDAASRSSETHFVKTPQGLSLGKLHKVHMIYRKVMHHEIGAQEGIEALDAILREPPIYGLGIRCLIAFFSAGLICPLAFGGSFVDTLVSGSAGALLCWLQLHVAQKNELYANVFEISVAIGISFIARALSSIRSQIFCYSAISSSGVVLILPGYLILCSSLELGSKNIICGSVKMIYAIIYSLFLGFGLTIGSDMYFLLDTSARHARLAAAQGAATGITLAGTFRPNNATLTPFAGAFTFTNSTSVTDLPDIVEGCFRDPEWPWYLQAFPYWTVFIIVPVFSIISSLGNLQPLRSKQLVVMVVISCASFAANTAANRYIFNRSDVVSAIGAFVVGILGNLYSRVFKGTAFTSMVTGVLFLVPSGIAAAGGLSQNYVGAHGDQYSNGLQIGLRMVQVAMGITVGLFSSSLLVYSFGKRKTGASFAF